MGSSKSHALDPLDLEIIDLVYEVAWQQVSVRQPPRDEAEVEERQAFLASGALEPLQRSHGR